VTDTNPQCQNCRCMNETRASWKMI